MSDAKPPKDKGKGRFAQALMEKRAEKAKKMVGKFPQASQHTVRAKS